MNVKQCVQRPESLMSAAVNTLDYATKGDTTSEHCSIDDDAILTETLSHLLEILPIAGLWISKKYSKTGPSHQTYYAKDPDYFSTESIQYLASEQWLTDGLDTHQRIFLRQEGLATKLSQPYFFADRTGEKAKKSAPLEKLSVKKDSLNPGHVTLQNSDLSSYWLVWVHEPLTQIHKYCIEQQIQHLCVRQKNQQINRQLSQQVRSLRKGLSRIEHQLRTPLSLVEICANILHENTPAQPLKDQAQFIRKTVDDINLLLKHLTGWDGATWDDIAEQNRTLCDLKQIVLDTIDSLRISIEQKEITIDSDMGSLMLTLNGWKMKQVFSNLLSNAISFSPVGSTISCHWQIFQTEVLIEICDQGPGFSAEDLAHLFTPSYSRRRNGTGLGMVIAKDIILAHQGRLWAANQPAGGAVVSIALPR